MIKVLLLLVYMLNGEVVIEQKAFSKMEECEAAGAKRAREVSEHPRFEGGHLAICVPARVHEALQSR